MTPGRTPLTTLLHRFFDWLDDRAIRRTVRERDAADTGERLTVDQLIAMHFESEETE